MGHLHTDMTVRGSKSAVELKNVLIDTGATYTVLPEKVLEGVGAWGEGAQTVIGVETLESIGLKLDPTTGKLEFTRPKGMAYFYWGRTSHTAITLCEIR